MSSSSWSRLAAACRRALNERRRGVIHLFLLSPPLSGSTVLAQLLRTSRSVSVLPDNGEGQFLPRAAPELLVDDRWDPELEVDWRRVRRAFLEAWSPLRPVRFEKSPPSLVRAADLERWFPDSRFLILLRDPYAQVEGVLRHGWPFGRYGPQSSPAPPATVERAARFWLRTAELQERNAVLLERTCRLTYEELTDRTEATLARIRDFVPQIGRLRVDRRFAAHNVRGESLRGLHNLNEEKIARLRRDQIDRISAVLAERRDLVARSGYTLRD